MRQGKKMTATEDEPDARELRAEKEREAENRRKLLATLEPATREMAIREFAKLGLHQ